MPKAILAKQIRGAYRAIDLLNVFCEAVAGRDFALKDVTLDRNNLLSRVTADQSIQSSHDMRLVMIDFHCAELGEPQEDVDDTLSHPKKGKRKRSDGRPNNRSNKSARAMLRRSTRTKK
ncbi:hypothetical protein K3495_g4242 [Podosphaera aphanis]|nr:hypothetical protein K3495_g4242 [Podosphaera aphanis]